MASPAVYAILRAIPDKLGGVIAMFGAIAVLFVLPWLDTSRVRSATFRPIYRRFMFVLGDRRRGAGLLRRQPAGRLLDPCWLQVATLYYFVHFLILLPILARSNGRCHCPVNCRRRAQEQGGLRTCARCPRSSWSGAIALASLGAGVAAIAAGTTEHPPHKIGISRGRSAPMTGGCSARLPGLCRGLRCLPSLSLLAYRNLMELGLTEAQVKGLIRTSSSPTSTTTASRSSGRRACPDRFKVVPQRARRRRRQQEQGAALTSA